MFDLKSSYRIDLSVPRRSLFNEFYNYNSDADELSGKFDRFIGELFKEYCGDKGYSPRELAEILHQGIETEMSSWTLAYACVKKGYTKYAKMIWSILNWMQGYIKI